MTEAVTYQTDTSDLLIPHGFFRSVFASAEPIIQSVRPGDAEQTAAVSSYFDNVLRFLDAHHDGEDAIIWPVLSERCSSAGELIARMEGEHEAIHELKARAAALLTEWSNSADPAAAAALAGALTSLGAKVDSHFGEEEAEVLPLASRNMSAEEWGGLPGHAMAHFTGDKIWLILGLILEQMTDEERAATLQLLPPPAVEMWTTSGKAAFDDFISRVRQGL
jgi:iron-sulfur cluster repair protein YtfE (RIC family)